MTKEERDALSRICEDRVRMTQDAFNDTKATYNLGRFEEAVFLKYLISEITK
jgi:hypothetical protein